MSPVKLAAKSLIWFVLSYGVLNAGWWWIGGAYAAAFRASGQAVFGWFWRPDARIEFKPISERVADATHDNIILVSTPYSSQVKYLTNSTELVGYAPTVMFVALMFGTPLPWRRRLPALALGLILVELFVLARTGIAIVDVLSASNDPNSLYVVSASVKRLLSGLAKGVAYAPPVSYIAPTVIWMAVTFRRGDWNRLTRGDSPKSDSDDH